MRRAALILSDLPFRVLMSRGGGGVRMLMSSVAVSSSVGVVLGGGLFFFVDFFACCSSGGWPVMACWGVSVLDDESFLLRNSFDFFFLALETGWWSEELSMLSQGDSASDVRRSMDTMHCSLLADQLGAQGGSLFVGNVVHG